MDFYIDPGGPGGHPRGSRTYSRAQTWSNISNKYFSKEFSKNKDIDLKNTNLNGFLSIIIKESYYKADNAIKNIVYEYLEFFLIKNISIKYTDVFKYFLKRINDVKKYNLDEESLFIEVNKKLLNG